MYRALLLFFLLVASRAEAQSFLVFFDWDRATLTDQGRQTIHQAANTALQLHAMVEVDGFTDTSGSMQYNDTLSWQRAQVVANELRLAGLSPDAVRLRGLSENYPRLPTPDNVREPQNRRVAIIIHAPLPPPPAPRVVPYVLPFPWVGPVYPWGGYGGWRGYGGGWRGGYAYRWRR